MKPFLVALTGPIGSGKDTLFKALQEDMGAHTVSRVKFADPLYKMAAVLDPAFYPEMPQEAKKENLWGIEGEPTRRTILETLGTEWGRALRPGLWIELAMRAVKAATTPLVIINDLRFKDEYDRIKEEGGLVVHLRPDWHTINTGHASDFGLPIAVDDSILPLTFGKVDEGVRSLREIILAARLAKGGLTLGDSFCIP